MLLYAPIDRAPVPTTAHAVALHSANSSFANAAVDYFSSGENPLLHTWSLAVEQQFYMVSPLLLLAVGAMCERSDTRAVAETVVVNHCRRWRTVDCGVRTRGFRQLEFQSSQFAVRHALHLPCRLVCRVQRHS